MEVTINNTLVPFDSQVNLEQALDMAGVKQTRGIAIALNNQVVPKVNWSQTALKDKDDILVIQATQGG